MAESDSHTNQFPSLNGSDKKKWFRVSVMPSQVYRGGDAAKKIVFINLTLIPWLICTSMVEAC